MEPVQKVYEAVAFDLASLLDAGEGAVVLLEAGETRLAAHTAVLAARSPVFSAMFRHDTTEASSREVRIGDVEGPVLRQLLAYLYTSRAPHLQLPGMAAPLLAAADKYGVLDLKEECERQVRAQLSVETAAAAAVLAVRHSCPGLRQAAVSFIRDHSFQVMATQGWADAVRSQPEDVLEIHRLLAELHQETNRPSVRPAIQAGLEGRTSADDAPPTSANHATPPAEGAASLHRNSTGSQAEHHVQTATVPPAAARHTAPLDEAAVSRYRKLSAAEKGSRLIEAAKEGAAGEVQALLVAGADVTARDGNRRTALHWAAWRGHADVASCLLAGGAEVDARTKWETTPLILAAYYGHTAVVQLLAAASADLNARGNLGRTALQWAARGGQAEAAAALLEAGADRELRDNDGRTPLDLAANQQLRQLLTES